MSKNTMRKIENLMMENLGLKERPAIALCYTTEKEDFKECHWATNVTRVEGVRLFRETADKMLAQTN